MHVLFREYVEADLATRLGGERAAGYQQWHFSHYGRKAYWQNERPIGQTSGRTPSPEFDAVGAPWQLQAEA